MPAFLAIIFTILSLVWSTARIVASVHFSQDCGGILKQAADASDLNLAAERLQIAIAYIEKENLTSGYTSVLYKTPDEDVGFWYKNLNSALDELKKVQVDSNATSLEKSNVLIKLRETLLDNGESGTSLTVPDGISVFPSNSLWAFLGLMFWFLCITFWCWAGKEL